MASDKAWDDMSKLLKQFIQMPDAEPFRTEVDWKALGLFDYPQIIKNPMDLGKIKKKLAARGTSTNSYNSLYEVADDVRLVWSNCMAYNADGSDFYILAQTLSDKFEKGFSKLLQDHALSPPNSNNASSAGGGLSQNDVSLDDKRSFAKSLYKITKDELGKILVTLDEKCPAALVKNGAEDEVELNVDKISKDVFTELVQFVAQCQANHKGGKAKSKGGNGAGAGTAKPVAKKAKTN